MIGRLENGIIIGRIPNVATIRYGPNYAGNDNFYSRRSAPGDRILVTTFMGIRIWRVARLIVDW